MKNSPGYSSKQRFLPLFCCIDNMSSYNKDFLGRRLYLYIYFRLLTLSWRNDPMCKQVSVRNDPRPIFTTMEYEEEDGSWRFQLRFLGSVEVNGHKGDEVLCQAINKVALSRRSEKSSVPPPLCTVEISQYGIRMLDKSKTGHEDTDFTHFFALKNISFCGCHPRKDKYFAFITKHPKLYRFACHVFLGERSTRPVNDALGQAFKRFYQEYMAFTHPTEDIYME